MATSADVKRVKVQQPQPQQKTSGGIVTRCWQCAMKLDSDDVSLKIAHAKDTGHISFKTDVL